MKRRDLERKLRALGWWRSRHGKKHDVWTSGTNELVVPRHAEIKELMRLAGNITRDGKFWAVEVPMLEVFTQGRTRKEAFEMIADAIEMLIDRDGFEIDVYPGKSGYFEVGSHDQGTLISFLLRRQRVKHGLTLVEVARRLGARSHNTYARYEQGRATPTVVKLTKLLKAVSGGLDFVLVESRMS